MLAGCGDVGEDFCAGGRVRLGGHSCQDTTQPARDGAGVAGLGIASIMWSGMA